MKRAAWLTAGVVLAICIAGGGHKSAVAGADASNLSAAQMLPDSTVAYVELSGTQELLKLVMDSDLRKRVEGLDAYRQWERSDAYLKMRVLTAVLEQQTGLEWRSAVSTLTGGGIYAALDGASQGFALLVKSSDAATLAKVWQTVSKLARDDAERKGNPDPFPSNEYRGIATYKVDRGGMAIVGPWLIFVNNDKLGRAVLDRVLDGEAASLSGSEHFRAAREASGSKLTGWAYLNVKAVREAGAARKVFEERAENPIAELLFGGVQEALKSAPYATASLKLEGGSVGLTFATPHDSEKVSKVRAFHFPEGGAKADAALKPAGTIGTFTAYWDLGKMWMAADELFNEATAAGLAQADSNLSTFFSGKSFGREILAGLKPQIQFVAARQSFEAGKEPAIKLPGMALVLRMKDVKAMRPQLRVTYQTIVGFGNILGTQAGAPLLSMNNEQREDVELLTSSYMMENRPEGQIYWNFSPSVAMVDDYFIVSSTRKLAEELAAEAKKGGGAKSIGSSALLEVTGDAIAASLKDNHRQLVAQNQLEKGHTQAEAEKEIQTLLDVATMFKSASLELASREKTMELKVLLKLVGLESAK